jgi:exonuclease 3'-5' domain-containing protein 1
MELRIEKVDTTAAVKNMLDGLCHGSIKPADIFLELIIQPATNQISVCTIYSKSLHKAFVLEVYSFGSAAFFTSNIAGTSLKSIFEDPNTTKIVFDVRRAVNYLYKSFRISLAGIMDVQLMELALRPSWTEEQEPLATLADCIRQENITLDKEGRKQAGLLASAVASKMKEESTQVSSRQSTQRASVQSLWTVSYLPRLFAAYLQKLSPPEQRHWRAELELTTEYLIELAKTSAYDPQNPDMV